MSISKTEIIFRLIEWLFQIEKWLEKSKSDACHYANSQLFFCNKKTSLNCFKESYCKLGQSKIMYVGNSFDEFKFWLNLRNCVPLSIRLCFLAVMTK